MTLVSEHVKSRGARLSREQRAAIALMRERKDYDSGWAVLSSDSGSHAIDGQPWINWRTGLSLVRRDLAEHDEDFGLIRLWEHAPDA